MVYGGLEAVKIAKADRPRWRCDRCGYTLDEWPEAVTAPCCYTCDGGTFRPAPTLAEEQAEKRVVVATMHYFDLETCTGRRWLKMEKASKELRDARARARRASKENT